MSSVHTLTMQFYMKARIEYEGAVSSHDRMHLKASFIEYILFNMGIWFELSQHASWNHRVSTSIQYADNGKKLISSSSDFGKNEYVLTVKAGSCSKQLVEVARKTICMLIHKYTVDV